MDNKLVAILIFIAVFALVIFFLSRKYKKEDGTMDWVEVWKICGYIVFFLVVLLYMLIMVVASNVGSTKKEKR